MDKEYSDRCDSVELDTSLQFRIKASYATQTPSDQNTPHTSDSQVTDISFQNLHIKHCNLKRKNQELLFINKKWAEQYGILRQRFEWQVTELKRRLNSYEQRREEKEKQMEAFSSLTNDTKESLQEIERKSRLHEADREIQRLRVQCDTLSNRGQQQEEEIRRLNKVLQRMHKSLAVQQKSQQTEENIWRHQARVYKEDFLKERRDRDKLKEKYGELEKKFKKIQTDLYKTQVWWSQSSPSPHTSHVKLKEEKAENLRAVQDRPEVLEAGSRERFEREDERKMHLAQLKKAKKRKYTRRKRK